MAYEDYADAGVNGWRGGILGDFEVDDFVLQPCRVVSRWTKRTVGKATIL